MLRSSRILPLIRSIAIKTARTARHFSVSSGEGTWKTKLTSKFESTKEGFWRDQPTNLFVLGGFLALLGYMKMSWVDFDELPRALENSKVDFRNEKQYIARPELESSIVAVTNGLKSCCYFVVYGPKGAGKSEIIDHFAMGKTGVVKLVVTGAHYSDDVIAALSKQLLGRVRTGLNKHSLRAVVSKSKVKAIIFEVECDSDEGTILSVQTVAKAMIPYCICIIVLAETNEVLEFGRNYAREEFIYVGEMTHEEAKQLVHKILEKEEFKVDGKILQFSDEDLQYIFEKIGTNPMMLKQLVGGVVLSKMTVKQCVEDVLSRAEQDLVAFPHKLILKALKENPEGIALKYFNNKKREGVDLSDPDAVGPAIKKGAIIYRRELRQYQLLSTAHKTALKSYDPIISKSLW